MLYWVAVNESIPDDPATYWESDDLISAREQLWFNLKTKAQKRLPGIVASEMLVIQNGSQRNLEPLLPDSLEGEKEGSLRMRIRGLLRIRHDEKSMDLKVGPPDAASHICKTVFYIPKNFLYDLLLQTDEVSKAAFIRYVYSVRAKELRRRLRFMLANGSDLTEIQERQDQLTMHFHNALEKIFDM